MAFPTFQKALKFLPRERIINFRLVNLHHKSSRNLGLVKYDSLPETTCTFAGRCHYFHGPCYAVSVITLVKHIPKNSRVKVFANGIRADYKERGDTHTHTHTKNRLFPPSFFGSNKEGTSREIWDHSAKGLVPINTADLLLDRCHEIEYRLYLLIP